jgi:hypothetical protein
MEDGMKNPGRRPGFREECFSALEWNVVVEIAVA